MSRAVDEYRLLRSRVDERVRELVEMHRENLACRPGCCECCQNLSVFPVEYHAILEDLRRQGTGHLKTDDSASCAFLRDGLCLIYPFRPLICRTHGLPVAVCAADDADERRVMFCRLNFAGAGEDDLWFGPQNTLDLEQINQQLALINLRFSRERGMSPAEASRRIPLAQLAADLNGA